MTYYGTKTGAGVKRTRAAIEMREPFKAGGKFHVTHGNHYYAASSMAGAQQLDEHGIGPDLMGRLPDEWKDRLIADSPSYAVTSFGTPIAWFTEHAGWVVPAVKYSVTTSNHQTQVRSAVREYVESLDS